MQKQDVQDLLTDYSIETTVRESLRIERFADYVPSGTCIYIAHVPGTSSEDTIALARRLRAEGLEPVPHIVARRIESLKALDEILGRLVGEAGVKQILTVAGDISEPEGELESALQILDSGLIEKHGIRKIGVAGHPEGHKDVAEPALRDALKRKNDYAQKTGADVYVATQFTFSAEPIGAWEAATRDVNQLRVMVGVPGLATIKTLLKYALECGVGPSIHAVSRHARNLTKLVTVAAPDEMVVGLAAYRQANPTSLVAGVHFFPFGGLKRTAAWAAKVANGEFEFTKDGLETT